MAPLRAHPHECYQVVEPHKWRRTSDRLIAGQLCEPTALIGAPINLVHTTQSGSVSIEWEGPEARLFAGLQSGSSFEGTGVLLRRAQS